MKSWRVTVVDGHFKRHAGFGIVMADTEDAARALMVGYLSNDHAYAKPYEVSEVEPYKPADPSVVFFNWGEWPEWPLAKETPDQST